MANIAGFLGLFLGLSVFSLFEPIQALIDILLIKFGEAKFNIQWPHRVILKFHLMLSIVVWLKKNRFKNIKKKNFNKERNILKILKSNQFQIK